MTAEAMQYIGVGFLAGMLFFVALDVVCGWYDRRDRGE